MVASALLGSCTATSGPPLELGATSFAASNISVADVTDQGGGSDKSLAATATTDPANSASPKVDKATPADAAANAPSAPPATEVAEGDAALPAQVAAVPAVKPDAPAAEAAVMPKETAAAAQAEKPVQVAMSVPDAPAAAKPDEAQAAQPTDAVKPTAFLENGPGPAQPPAKKRGFLAGLFANQPTDEAPRPVVRKAAVRSTVEDGSTPALTKAATPAPAPVVKPATALIAKEKAEKPLVMLASTGPASGFSGEALPGVRRQTALFEITRKSGIDDDSDIDLHEDEEFVQVASAAGMARLAPNGLLKQTEGVDVGCLKPSLVRVLKTVEQYYGKKMVVTSGFRSPERNRKARGARNSLHMYCAAADVQVPGVSKWELAKFVRSMPGRGGVGTYCHTESVHIDVGPERDWNWRCRRKKA